MNLRIPFAFAVSTAIVSSLLSAPAFADHWNYCGDYADRARLRAGSDSPMAWNPNQWRSTLMPDYSRASDNCTNKVTAGVARIEIRRILDVERTNATETQVAHARPLLRIAGQPDSRFSARAALARKMRPPCGRSGPLILVWTGARAERACAPAGAWRGRIMAPSADLSLDKG